VQDDQLPLALINHEGQPRLATLVCYPRSFAFHNGGLRLVFDTSTQQLEEPRLDERERAMDFATGTTVGPES
jgi:hypothetical protein